MKAIVAGGVALVAGLWMATYLPAWSPLWLAGAVLALVGVASLAGGIWVELGY